MKKLIGALALAAMVVTSAFAEVSFGAWICNLPTLIGSDGEDIKGAAVSNPWGGWRVSRMAFNWTADDGKAGLVLGVDANKNGDAEPTGLDIGFFGPTKIWIKPVDSVKFSLGGYDCDIGLNVPVSFGSWNWLRPSTIYTGDDNLTITTCAADKGHVGLGLEFFPTDGLYIFAMVPLAANGWSGTSLKRMDKAYGKSVVGASYNIGDIGQIKAQFYGEYTGEKDAQKYGKIEGAFDLTGIDKLTATVGVSFRVAQSDYWKTGISADDKKAADKAYMLKAALAASYGITETFKVSANFAMYMFNKDVADDPAMTFGVGLDYALSDALGLVADVRMAMPNNKIDPTLSFLAGINYACGSNASLGVGFQGIVGFGKDAAAGSLKVVEATAGDKFAWAVPIRASVWF